MFNKRRIHTATNVGGPYYYFDEDYDHHHRMYDNVESHLRATSFKFARRPFAGATRVLFVWEPVGSIGVYTNQVGAPEDDAMWLCAPKCQQLIGLGRNVKKFSIWFKTI